MSFFLQGGADLPMRQLLRNTERFCFCAFTPPASHLKASSGPVQQPGSPGLNSRAVYYPPNTLLRTHTCREGIPSSPPCLKRVSITEGEKRNYINFQRWLSHYECDSLVKFLLPMTERAFLSVTAPCIITHSSLLRQLFCEDIHKCHL